MIKKYIIREDYLNKVIPFVRKNIIKIIIGQRRVGKSYLLYQIMDYIKKKFRKSNIIYINKELYNFDFIHNYKNLIKYVKEKTIQRRMNFIFIDEIQDIEKFEIALRDLNTHKKYDIYCTGSNANLLSSDIATHLSGRYIEIPVSSLSYKEFIKFHKLENERDSLLKYIKFGGMPYLVNLALNEDAVYDYLKNIYNTILLKDVVSRYNIRNVNFLERLIEYLANNTGNLISAKKISDFLKSQRIKISPNIVLNYLSYLTSAFFIYKVKRMEINGKKIFEVNEKYYFEDIGIRHSLIGYRNTDINKVLENIVYHHLKTKGYNIHIGVLNNKEVDFICEKAGERLYIQVAYLITNKKVRTREFDNLLVIKDNYPKIVVSMDDIVDKSYKGIIHMNIMDFLNN